MITFKNKTNKKGNETMEIRITKREKLDEWNNSMCSGVEYCVHGRIINDDKTRYRPFKFIANIDGQDLWKDECDDENEDCYTYREYLDECVIPSFTDNIQSYDDCKYFYSLCNETINKYNETIRRRNSYYGW